MKQVTAFVGKMPQKFSQRKIPRVELIIVALIAGSIGAYALLSSRAATPCTPDLNHLTAVGCPVVKSDTAASGNPADVEALWGHIECADPSRLQLVSSGGDDHVTASGAPQGNTSYYKATTIDGDNFYGERCELGRNERRYGDNGGAGTFELYQQGEHKVTFFSMRVPSNLQINQNMWQAIMQMKQTEPRDTAYASPILEADVYDGVFSVWSDPAGELWTTPAVAGTWVRFAFDITYSQNGNGKLKVYVDLNDDGDTLDSGEQSPVITTPTLGTQTATSQGGAPVLQTGDPVPSHLRLGIYHNPDYSCPAPAGCTTDDDNIQVVDLTSTSTSPPVGDTTAPTVSLTAPTNGANLSGTATPVSANAADNVGVVGVQFKIDGGNMLTEDTTSPYGITWNTTNSTNGTHVISAVARDAAGNTTTSNSATVTVNNAAADTTPPNTTITANPASSTTSSAATFSFTSSEANSTFVCSLDSGSYIACSSPKAYTGLALGSHTFNVKATDPAGNQDASAATYTWSVITPPDTTAPNAPTNLTATATSATTVNLAWTGSTDTGANQTGVTKYNVLRNGVVIAQPTGTSYTDSGLTANTAYNYSVQAVDGASNASANSNTATATTPAIADTTAPTVPGNLTATAVSINQVNLSWAASSDSGGSGVAGYNIYRNGSSTKLNSSLVTTTSYGDTTADAATTYTYRVEAVDGAGNKSAKTSSVSATTPPIIRGDLSGAVSAPDGKIDIHDASYIARVYNTNDSRGDITGPHGVPDGIVDIYDASFISKNYQP